jgi:hypothetical protein
MPGGAWGLKYITSRAGPANSRGPTEVRLISESATPVAWRQP